MVRFHGNGWLVDGQYVLGLNESFNSRFKMNEVHKFQVSNKCNCPHHIRWRSNGRRFIQPFEPTRSNFTSECISSVANTYPLKISRK